MSNYNSDVDSESEANIFLESIQRNYTFEHSSANNSAEEQEEATFNQPELSTAREEPVEIVEQGEKVTIKKLVKMDKPSTISKQDAQALSLENLKIQIGEIVEHLSHLERRELEIKESTSDIVERRYLLRTIKINRNILEGNLKELSATKTLKELNVPTIRTSTEEDEETTKERRNLTISKDEQKLVDTKKTEYHRLINLCIRTKEDIKSRKTQVLEMLKIDTQLLTDFEKRERDIQIKVHLKTVQERVDIYKKYNAELTRICDHDDIKQLMENLSEVLDEANYMTCLFESITERQKTIEANSSPNALANVTIEKFDGQGIDRFLRYRSWVLEFNDFVLLKPVPDLIKLRWLKNSLEGEALKLVKAYTLGGQLATALEVLENAYSKQELIIAEIYRSFKQIARVTTFTGENLAKAKAQINTLKVGLATLDSMGLMDEMRHTSPLQTTFLLTELEAKIPIPTYLKWYEEKDKLAKNGENPNVEHFTEFYERAVETQSDAVYIRNRLDEISGSKKDDNKAGKTSKSHGKSNKVSGNLLRTEGNKGNAATSSGNDSGLIANWESLPMKGKYKDSYCLWDNCRGHSSYRCLNTKIDHEAKMKILASNKACKHCLKTGKASHEKDCEKKRTCLICKQSHNLNLHGRKEILAALKERKEQQQSSSAPPVEELRNEED